MLLGDIFLESICRFTNTYALKFFLWKWSCSKLLNLYMEGPNFTRIDHLYRPNFAHGYYSSKPDSRLLEKHRLFNIPSFKDYMSWDRFLIILRCLYFCLCRPTDNQQASTTRTTQSFSHWKNRWSSTSFQYQNDEYLLPFKGTIHWRVYSALERMIVISIYKKQEP